jgi:hypothetical protein
MILACDPWWKRSEASRNGEGEKEVMGCHKNLI